MANEKQRKRKMLLHRIKMSKQVYFLLLPVLVWLIIYSYVPMYGIILAWKDYSAAKGIWGSKWVGWEHFEFMFSDPRYLSALRNTLTISITKLIVTFPAPLILALLINEVRVTGYRRAVQTLTYLPHFISWVVLSGIIKSFLSPETGALNQLLEAWGFEKVAFMYEPDLFIPILLFAEILKGTGWASIIYLASIMAIDATMYEAAEIDGCGHFKRIWFITIPSILPTVAMQLVLALASIMEAGFGSIYNLYNPATESVAEIIDTIAYKTFLKSGEWELSAAMGMFKMGINFILMLIGNIVTKKMTGYSMYSFDN